MPPSSSALEPQVFKRSASANQRSSLAEGKGGDGLPSLFAQMDCGFAYDFDAADDGVLLLDVRLKVRFRRALDVGRD